MGPGVLSREDHPAALGTHAPSSPAQTRRRLAARRLDVGTPHAYTAPLQRGLCLVGGQGQCGLPTQEPVGKRWLLAEDRSSSCGQDPHVGPEKHLGENRENLRPHSATPSSVARRYQPALRSALSWAAWPRDTQSPVPQESRVSHARIWNLFPCLPALPDPAQHTSPLISQTPTKNATSTGHICDH